MKPWLLLVLLFAPLTVHAAAAPPDTAVTTVILVRHAEKNDHPPGGDAGLATKGLVRAQDLARVLASARVKRVYASQYGRAQMTAQPLAAAIGDSVRTYDANHLERLAQRIREEGKGATVVVVGHADTIQETIEDLIGRPLETKEAAPYDRMWVLTLTPGGAFKVVRLSYGSKAD